MVWKSQSISERYRRPAQSAGAGPVFHILWWETLSLLVLPWTKHSLGTSLRNHIYQSSLCVVDLKPISGYKLQLTNKPRIKLYAAQRCRSAENKLFHYSLVCMLFMIDLKPLVEIVLYALSFVCSLIENKWKGIP